MPWRTPDIAGVGSCEDQVSKFDKAAQLLTEDNKLPDTKALKRPIDKPNSELGRKRQRSASDISCGGDWSSSETCMSERSISHSQASSSSASSRLSRSVQQQSIQQLWHSLPSPVPATLSEVAELREHRNRQPCSRWDLLCAVDFSPDGTLLATAGVGKQVHIYPVNSEESQSDIIFPSECHWRPNKLSSLDWSPAHQDTLAIGDYDGTVTQLNASTGQILWHADEHDGARIWSINHSQLNPATLVSACEDGTACIWTSHSDTAAAVISTDGREAICAAEFSPTDEHLLALACADHNAYVYDLRAMQHPLYILEGHEAQVSYVRFLASGHDLITASVDNSLAHWQITEGPTANGWQHHRRKAARPSSQSSFNAAASMQLTPVTRFRGHQNTINFVGLAVEPSTDLIACGSEDGRVYLYHTAWSDPMGHRTLFSSRQGSFPSSYQGQSNATAGPMFRRSSNRSFASAVAWQPHSSLRSPDDQLLAAALSDSGVQLFRPQFASIDSTA